MTMVLDMNDAPNVHVPRPTIEQIKAARERLSSRLQSEDGSSTQDVVLLTNESIDAVRVLVAALEPVTDDEIYNRYESLLRAKGYSDQNELLPFAWGVEAFIGRAKSNSCACGNCKVKA